MNLQENSVVEMNVQGRKRKVYVGEQRDDGSYSARLRGSRSGNSVRGKVRMTKQGPRFQPTNKLSVFLLD